MDKRSDTSQEISGWLRYPVNIHLKRFSTALVLTRETHIKATVDTPTQPPLSPLHSHQSGYNEKLSGHVRNEKSGGKCKRTT